MLELFVWIPPLLPYGDDGEWLNCPPVCGDDNHGGMYLSHLRLMAILENLSWQYGGRVQRV